MSRSGRAIAAPMPLARPRPIDWNACVNTKPAGSGTRRYIGGKPMKCPESTATVRSSGSSASSAIESVRGSRRPSVAGVLERRRRATSRRRSRSRPGRRRGRRCSARRRRAAPRAVAAASPTTRGVHRPVRAERLLVEVDLHDLGAAGDQRAVARRPAGQRRRRTPARGRTPRSAARRSARRSRRRSRPPTASPANSPWPIAEVASTAPIASPSASSGSRAPASTAPRPAMMTGRRAAAISSATSATASGDGAGACGSAQQAGRGAAGRGLAPGRRAAC